MGTQQSTAQPRGIHHLQISLRSPSSINNDLPCLLRCCRRWSPHWQGYHGVENRRRAKNLRELPCSLHRGEGVRLQGVRLPPRDPQLHVPGWRLHCWKWYWRKVHLWQQVRGRELHPEAHWTWNPLHGQRWPQHQRLPVFPVYCQDPVVGRETRGLRTGRRGHGCREEGRELWVSVRQNLKEDRHCRLWPVLDLFPQHFPKKPNVIASHWAIIMY